MDRWISCETRPSQLRRYANDNAKQQSTALPQDLELPLELHEATINPYLGLPYSSQIHPQIFEGSQPLTSFLSHGAYTPENQAGRNTDRLRQSLNETINSSSPTFQRNSMTRSGVSQSIDAGATYSDANLDPRLRASQAGHSLRLASRSGSRPPSQRSQRQAVSSMDAIVLMGFHTTGADTELLHTEIEQRMIAQAEASHRCWYQSGPGTTATSQSLSTDLSFRHDFAAMSSKASVSAGDSSQTQGQVGSGERPYRCNYCPGSFRNKTDLRSVTLPAGC